MHHSGGSMAAAVMHCFRRDRCHAGDLPSIKAVSTGRLTATERGTNEPEDGEDHCCHPQKVHRESGTEEQKHYEEYQ